MAAGCAVASTWSGASGDPVPMPIEDTAPPDGGLWSGGAGLTTGAGTAPRVGSAACASGTGSCCLMRRCFGAPIVAPVEIATARASATAATHNQPLFLFVMAVLRQAISSVDIARTPRKDRSSSGRCSVHPDAALHQTGTTASSVAVCVARTVARMAAIGRRVPRTRSADAKAVDAPVCPGRHEAIGGAELRRPANRPWRQGERRAKTTGEGGRVWAVAAQPGGEEHAGSCLPIEGSALAHEVLEDRASGALAPGDAVVIDARLDADVPASARARNESSSRGTAKRCPFKRRSSGGRAPCQSEHRPPFLSRAFNVRSS